MNLVKCFGESKKDTQRWYETIEGKRISCNEEMIDKLWDEWVGMTDSKREDTQEFSVYVFGKPYLLESEQGQTATGKPVPINWAKKIAEDLGYTQVIIHGYDGNTGIQHVTTFGKSLADSDNAAKGGNVIKRMLGFPEEACQSVPARVKRKLQKESK